MFFESLDNYGDARSRTEKFYGASWVGQYVGNERVEFGIGQRGEFGKRALEAGFENVVFVILKVNEDGAVERRNDLRAEFPDVFARSPGVDETRAQAVFESGGKRGEFVELDRHEVCLRESADGFLVLGHGHDAVVTQRDEFVRETGDVQRAVRRKIAVEGEEDIFVSRGKRANLVVERRSGGLFPRDGGKIAYGTGWGRFRNPTILDVHRMVGADKINATARRGRADFHRAGTAREIFTGDEAAGTRGWIGGKACGDIRARETVFAGNFDIAELKNDFADGELRMKTPTFDSYRFRDYGGGGRFFDRTENRVGANGNRERADALPV